MSSINVALDYVRRGWAPIPVPWRSKQPVLPEWQRLRIIDEPGLIEHFNGTPQNIGVLLGIPSSGLVDCDLDALEALGGAPAFLPPTRSRFGRPSRRDSHWLYIVEPPPKKTERWRDPEVFDQEKGTLLELRSTGGQTLFPGSEHPNAEPITWDEDGEVARVDGVALRAAMVHLAVTCLLARHWPTPGTRHETALAAAGFLLRSGLTPTLTERIVYEAARAARDEEAGNRRTDVTSTVARLRAGQPATGGRTLAELLRGDGRKTVRAMGAWIESLGAPGPTGTMGSASVSPSPVTLTTVHEVFTKRLGPEYDLEVLDTVLAVAASERLTGDPAWLLVVSGPGNAKTETVQSLEGGGGILISTIASEGALLSASSGPSRAKDATGGLLRQIGDRGLLVIKDVTSILSADRNVRNQVIAALREIHDVRWVRTVGVDGGKSLSWSGRIVLIGAVTTAWDAAHSVLAACGDRFLLVRADSRQHRLAKSQRARKNTGHERAMREEFATVVGRLLAGIPADHTLELADDRWDELVAGADLVTLLRTAVETDYKGDVLFAHAPEVATRLVKQLGQLMRGATAIGASVDRAFQLALRVCRDCAPPTRLRVLLDLAEHPNSKASDCGRRLGIPRQTTQRLCDTLRALELLESDEYEGEGKPWQTTAFYTVARTVPPPRCSPD
jgi:hypothetical protein